MGIKKIIRSLIIISFIIFILYIIFSNSKYLWKILGYTLCENVDGIQIHSVHKDTYNKMITIQGTANDSKGYYTSYSWRTRGENLYIALKYNKYFGYENKTKDFKLEIPCNVYDIKNIYLVDGTKERKI